MLDSADPNWFVPATATAITRYRVRLSGSGTAIVACPWASVIAEGTNNASASKFCRCVMCAACLALLELDAESIDGAAIGVAGPAGAEDAAEATPPAAEAAA